jgi:primase-polymerase (primpol)-like protein
MDTYPYPHELRNRRQWVCWRLERRKGKATKIPITPRTGANASTDDSSTWGTFDEALAGVQRFRCQGIGFVFTAADPYFGVDLDKCIDVITGEIAPWAQAIIDSLDTYTSLSQSGTGVHLIGNGTLPSGRRRNGQREMYDRGRFFALTGQHFPGTPLTIENRQAEIVALHAALFPPQAPQRPTTTGRPSSVLLTDAEVLEKMFVARNGADIQRLWAGDTSAYASASEADLALCSHLAFWVGAMRHGSMPCFGNRDSTGNRNGTGRTTGNAPSQRRWSRGLSIAPLCGTAAFPSSIARSVPQPSCGSRGSGRVRSMPVTYWQDRSSESVQSLPRRCRHATTKPHTSPGESPTDGRLGGARNRSRQDWARH